MNITKHVRKKLAASIVIIIVLILAVWLVFGDSSDNGNMEKSTIIITNSDEEEFELTVEIADEKEERKNGLMERESLCENCGMLFVYEEDVHGGFWMKDTYIPLSIAFISENGTINEIQHMQPRTTDLHRPEGPY